MKKLKIIMVLLYVTVIWSCNEDKWLTEEPFSFYATENSYTTVPQFKKALNYLYNELRNAHFSIGGDSEVSLHFADMAYGGTDYPDNKFNNLKTWLVPTAGVANVFWERGYRCIMNANTIISRLEKSNVGEEDKAAIEGEALFFRAYWYNILAIYYGDIPVFTEEITSARTDFTRAPRREVFEQARIDLERAQTLLKDVNQVIDGKINKQAVLHLLAEVYLSLGDYTKSIEAATNVIDHPQMELMTTRFGTRADEPGDPYWDLFQNNNQNRASSGNTESILVMQFEYLNSGSTYGYVFPRQGLPTLRDVRVPHKDTGADITPFPDYSQNLGGRGIGVIHPTDHFLDEIWGEDGQNDYRNSSYIIVRDYRIENPLAAGYGEWIIADGHLKEEYKLRHCYPSVMKFSRTDELPEVCYAKNADGSYKISGLGNKIYAYTNSSHPHANSSMKDEYLFRLAGTYLLRAEAYILNNQLDLALGDINALRSRANATPAKIEEINLDYLMDEQMRELYFEDYRFTTLLRMGKLVDRTRKYNPRGINVGDHQNLFPIPYSEIERNKDVLWENNPGYN